MKSADFEKILEQQINQCESVMMNKAKEYATEDRLHNFKVAAGLQGTSPEQALAGMMCKHTVSIYDMCRAGEYDITVWDEKITDHINYLLLLRALVGEKPEEDYHG